MRALLLLLFLPALASAQLKLLHFTRTSGYDHGTREESLAMFQSIALDLGYVVTNDDLGDAFNDPGTLSEFTFIVFSNTSGDAILDTQQRANFEQWVADGGLVLGIHAASDTYRHSTANGNNTGTWDFYAELIGASVQEDPNHVSGTPSYAMQHVGTNTSTQNLPDPWVKEEEYYYWEGGYYDPANVEVLRVEETVGPNGQVNSYDAPRPMSWWRATPTSRSFCTALGHDADDFTSDALFREHIRGALRWLEVEGTAIRDHERAARLMASPMPASDRLRVQCEGSGCSGSWRLLDLLGRGHLHGALRHGTNELDLSGAAPGIYQLVAAGTSARVVIAR